MVRPRRPAWPFLSLAGLSEHESRPMFVSWHLSPGPFGRRPRDVQGKRQVDENRPVLYHQLIRLPVFILSLLLHRSVSLRWLRGRLRRDPDVVVDTAVRGTPILPLSLPLEPLFPPVGHHEDLIICSYRLIRFFWRAKGARASHRTLEASPAGRDTQSASDATLIRDGRRNRKETTWR